jgi:hypothetical protein
MWRFSTLPIQVSQCNVVLWCLSPNKYFPSRQAIIRHSIGQKLRHKCFYQRHWFNKNKYRKKKKINFPIFICCSMTFIWTSVPTSSRRAHLRGLNIYIIYVAEITFHAHMTFIISNSQQQQQFFFCFISYKFYSCFFFCFACLLSKFSIRFIEFHWI